MSWFGLRLTESGMHFDEDHLAQKFWNEVFLFEATRA